MSRRKKRGGFCVFFHWFVILCYNLIATVLFVMKYESNIFNILLIIINRILKLYIFTCHDISSAKLLSPCFSWEIFLHQLPNLIHLLTFLLRPSAMIFFSQNFFSGTPKFFLRSSVGKIFSGEISPFTA